jgi:hypothetical protein
MNHFGHDFCGIYIYIFHKPEILRCLRSAHVIIFRIK